MTTEILLILGGGMLTALLAASAVVGSLRQARVQRRLSALTLSKASAGNPPLLQSAWLDQMGWILLTGGKDRQEIALYLREAGYYTPSGVIIFAGLRLAGMFAAAGVTGFVLWERGDLAGLARLAPLAAAGLAFILAKNVLRSRAAVRLRRVAKELPFVLDVMVLMLESGISLDQAFRYLAQTEANATPMSRHAMRELVEDLTRGQSYELALDRWADRMGVTGSRELAALFKQSLLHGVELAPALKEFVREFTERRIALARESIGRKTTKMTVVMIVFMLPALMIILAGPAVVSVMHAFHQVQKK
jgi:tight adherence protein C